MKLKFVKSANVVMVPTMNFRYLALKNWKDSPGYMPTLQQQFVDANGSGYTEWHDIKTVEEE